MGLRAHAAAVTSWKHVLSSEVLESDNRYFEMGAEIRQLSSGVLAWAPGCSAIPPGCLALRIDKPCTAGRAMHWIAEFESATREVGGYFYRLYLQQSNPMLAEALLLAGYRQRDEVVFLTPAGQAAPPTTVTLRPVTTRSEWDVKCRVDAESDKGPDGYTTDELLWHECLRRKWETGRLPFYFIEREEEICGTVGSIEMEHVLRLKNIVIRPAYRNRGTGREAVFALWRKALQSGKQALGVFAVPGRGGFATYRSAGLETTIAQSEWIKEPGVVSDDLG